MKPFRSLPTAVLVGLLGVALGACRDENPLAPEPASPNVSALAASTAEEGCARYEVRLSGKDRIEIGDVTGVECGPVRPVIVGAPAFDRTTQRVRIPIALENRGERKLKAPARLLGWQDSLTVVSPGGLARNAHTQRYLAFTGPDSSTDGTQEGTLLWSFDDQFAGSQPPVLAPGARSSIRWVEIAVHPGVETFRVSFRADAKRASIPVPAEPVRGLSAEAMAEIYAPGNIVQSAPQMTGPYPRDVVWILFRDDAPQADRQAAVDLIGGEVIGGAPIRRGGIYYVRIQHDGTANPLFAAIDRLKVLPQIALATPDLSLATAPSFRLPEDGTGWKKTDWRLEADSAAGANWGLEAIAAPLAWGCETGDSAQSYVGVVDNGFHAVNDLTPNVVPNPDIGKDTTQHGTHVASIIGARGNNAIGMTGVMWRTRMRVYDYALRPAGALPPAYNPYLAMADAANNGVSVINLSSAYYWQQVKGRLPWPYIPGAHPDSMRADSALARAIGGVMYQTVQGMGPAAPLVVLSASNDGIDAWWSGSAQVADSADVGRFVLVVAASNRAGSLASFSNRNQTRSLVSIAAPGEDVALLDRSASAHVVLNSGASFAAPYVSGVAGLLKSFDPRLTTTEIRSLILRGAARGRRTAGTLPVLNAHESLQAAAQRAGAPLCGNPVYQDSLGNVFTRRDSAWATQASLFSSGGSNVLAPLHGGKLVRFAGGSGFQWQPSGSWSPLASVPDTTGNPTNRSQAGQSHDGDTTVTVVKRPGPVPRYAEVWDVYLNGRLLTTVNQTQAPRVDAGFPVKRCVKWNTSGNEFNSCVGEFTVNSQIFSSHSVAYSSSRGGGGQVVLAIALETVKSSVEQASYVYGGYFQRNHETERQTAGTHLLFIDVKTGAVRKEIVPLFEAKGIGLSDDGERLVMQRANRFLNIAYTAAQTYTASNVGCDVAYQQIGRTSGLTRLFALPTIRKNTCYPEATFAP